MKQALRHFAAVLCLLTLVTSFASCMDLAKHTQAPCSHCTKHQPPNHPAPICCDAHQQPSATAAIITLEQPAQASIPIALIAHLDALALLSLPNQLLRPPPLLPSLKLRI
jgi:hypothetical protein